MYTLKIFAGQKHCFGGIQFFKIVINSHSQWCYKVKDMGKNVAYKVKKVSSNRKLNKKEMSTVKLFARQKNVVLPVWAIQFFKIVINSHPQSCCKVKDMAKNVAYKVKKVYSDNISTKWGIYPTSSLWQ